MTSKEEAIKLFNKYEQLIKGFTKRASIEGNIRIIKIQKPSKTNNMKPELENQEEESLCTMCNGTGEGMYDGSRCSVCGGSGEAKSKRDEFDGY